MTILSLGKTSKALAASTKDACSRLVDREMFSFIGDAHAIRRLLTDTRSLIIGEVPSMIIHRNTTINLFDNPLLTIIAPSGEAKRWRKLFIERGYKRWRVGAKDGEEVELTSCEGKAYNDYECSTINKHALAINNDMVGTTTGAQSMTRLMRKTPQSRNVQRINIYESGTHTALDVARHIHTTAHCNIITSNCICVPFPKLTMNGMFATPSNSRISPKSKIQLMVVNFKMVKMEYRMARGLFDRKSLLIDIRGSRAQGRLEPIPVGKYGGKTGCKRIRRRVAAIDD